MNNNQWIDVRDETTIDILKNLFTEKYSCDEKLKCLAELEKNRPEFIAMIKEFQPNYYLQCDYMGEESVASFNLIYDIQKNSEECANF